MPTVLTDRQRPSDVLLARWDERYDTITATIKNVSGGAIAAGAIKPGQPLNLNGSQWETADAAGESGVDGLFIDRRIVPALADDAVSTLEYKILVRGPAMVNLDAILDAAPLEGGAWVAADLETRLKALSPPIIVQREPATIETT